MKLTLTLTLTLAGAALMALAPAAAAQPASADVAFLHGMIPHHRQALHMAALVPERTTDRRLNLLARRISVSQSDEIAWMTRWLDDHGAPPAGAHHDGAHHDAVHHDGAHHPSMPGMLSPEEMTALAAADGPAFERLFLESMIRHHEGALVMVAELLASPGGAQETEVYQFASDIDADQRADIARMRSMLGAPLLAPLGR